MADVGRILREADFATKSEIVSALSEPLADHMVPHAAVRDAVYSVLSGSQGTLPPNYTNTDHVRFVQTALSLMFTIARHDKRFLVELMCASIEGDEPTWYVLAI